MNFLHRVNFPQRVNLTTDNWRPLPNTPQATSPQPLSYLVWMVGWFGPNMDFPPFKEIQFNLELNLRSGSNTATAEREGAFNAFKAFKAFQGDLGIWGWRWSLWGIAPKVSKSVKVFWDNKLFSPHIHWKAFHGLSRASRMNGWDFVWRRNF